MPLSRDEIENIKLQISDFEAKCYYFAEQMHCLLKCCNYLSELPPNGKRRLFIEVASKWCFLHEVFFDVFRLWSKMRKEHRHINKYGQMMDNAEKHLRGTAEDAIKHMIKYENVFLKDADLYKFRDEWRISLLKRETPDLTNN